MLGQMIANTMIVAAGYVLVGISFSLVFRACRFLNVSHAVPYVLAPYAVVALGQKTGFALFAAGIAGIAAACAFGAAVHYLVFRPLGHRNASSLVSLVASLGVYVVLRSSISLVFGEDTRYVNSPTAQVIDVMGARVTLPQMAIVFVSVTVFLMVLAAVRKTKSGSAYRAVAADRALATTCGLPVERVVSQAYIVGSAIAGLTGIVVGADIGVRPDMGLDALFMAVVVVIVGGRDSLLGLIPAAILISTAQTLGIWRHSSQWQDAIAFGVLLLFLVIRPQGILGSKLRSVAV